MRVLINGVAVPIRDDRLEIVIETDPAGETLRRGALLEFRGGRLDILESDQNPAVEIRGERQTSILGRENHCVVANGPSAAVPGEYTLFIEGCVSPAGHPIPAEPESWLKRKPLL